MTRSNGLMQQSMGIEVFRIGIHDSSQQSCGLTAQGRIFRRLRFVRMGARIRKLPLQVRTDRIPDRESFGVLGIDLQDRIDDFEALFSAFFLESLLRDIDQSDQTGSDGRVKRRTFARL
jgi:hypothetical protein